MPNKPRFPIQVFYDGSCIVCATEIEHYHRHHQQGVVYNFVKKIEVDICPFCKTYEWVYGKKAHEKRT